MFASGVRRSWLAHATSSRRASNSRSRFAAISLNEPASSATSVGPDSGARTVRSPCESATDASRTRSIEPAIERARNEAADHRHRRRGGETARILTSSPMWNMTQPERSTADERQADGECREADQLQPHRGQRPQQRARATSPTPSVTSDDSGGSEDHRLTAPAGSRRPRPSGDGAASDGSVSIFSRRRRTWTVTVPVSSAAS